MGAEPGFRLRFGGQDDAEAIARIVVETSAGLLAYLLGELFPGHTPEELLAAALGAESGRLSCGNCLLAEADGALLGLVYAYPADMGGNSVLERLIPRGRLEAARTILTAAEPGSLYVNTFWTAGAVRGQGLADLLMDQAETWARQAGCNGISLHVWADNQRALKFYARRGFAPVRHFPPPVAPTPPIGGHSLGSDLHLLRLP